MSDESCGERFNSATMKKIVHITSAHPPFDKRVFVKECRSLASCYEVVYIAPHDKDEIVDGVTIRHFKKPKGRYARFVRSMWGAFRDAIKENAAVYHFHDPDLLPMAFMLKLAGKKVIYDPHEDHPEDILWKDWIPMPLRRTLSFCVRTLECVGGACFDAITPATPPIARRFPPQKTTVIQNFPRLEEFDFPESTSKPRRRLMLCAGVISLNRGIIETLHAFAALRKEYPDLELILAGSFASSNEESLVRALPEWSDVTFTGWVSRQEISRMMHQASCGLVLFHPGPNHTESYPTKLFEFMASGLPIVASNFPLWRKIIEGNACGVTVDPKDSESVASGIRSILKNPRSVIEMGKNGIAMARRLYNWENEANKLLLTYKKITD